MDYNSVSNGDYGHFHQQDGQPSNTSDQPHHMFPWMASQPNLGPESLPRAPEDVVYEGFIPDAYPGLYNTPAAPSEDGPERHESNPYPVLHRPSREDNSDDEEPPTRHLVPDQEQDQASGDDVNTQARSKPKRGRKPRKSYAQPKKPKKGEGKRGGWCKGMKLGPRPHLDASPEFNKLYSEAVECIIAEPPNPQKAIELITQAIALNPEQHQAHPVLAEAHHMLGNDRSAIDILFVGAYANPRDPEAWQDVARRCQDWKGIGRTAALEKAIIAYSELINIDKHDYEARFNRAVSYREQGKVLKCIHELDKVLGAFPHNSSALEEYAHACIDLQRIPRALDMFKDAIEYHMEIGLGATDDPFDWSGVGVYVDLVARNGKPTETVPKAIRALKALSRWLLGRQSETYWEKKSLNNDAEFDLADEPRRIRVPEYMPAVRLPEAYGYGFPLELRAQLGILRLRHGDRSEALGHFSLLMEPVQEDGDSYVKQFSDLFVQVAKALADTKEHGEALRFYETIWKADALHTHDFWIGFGQSSYVCNKKEQALESFQKALACDDESVEAKTWIGKLLIERGHKVEAIEYLKEAVETGQSRITHKADTRVYEKKEPRLLREEAERTLKHAHQLVAPKVKKKYTKRKQDDEQDSQNLPNGGPDAEGSVPSMTPKKRRYYREPRGPRPLKIQLLPDEDEDLRHERVLQYYTTLNNNTEAMRSGDPIARGIWIDCAKSLIDDFRSTKVFFPKDHNQGLTPDLIEAINRLQSEPKTKHQDSRTSSQTPSPAPPTPSTGPLTLPTTYRTIPFTTWLDILLEYSLLLTHPPPDSPLNTPPNPSNKRPCYDNLALCLSCVLFSTSPTYTFQIHLCHLICSLAFRDQKTLFNKVLRWFMRECAFSSDSFRLFGAMNYYFPYFTPATAGQGNAFGGNGLGGKEGVMQRSIWRSGSTAKALRRWVYGSDKALVDNYMDHASGQRVPQFMREDRHETFTATETQTLTDPVTGVTTTTQVPLRTKEMDVVLLTLYGQVLYATGSYVSALSYFYRARAVDPRNPLVLLSIALSYMHQMLKKGDEGKDSRHVMVLQGWAMFQEYVDARMGWAETKEKRDGVKGAVEEVRREIGFNKARCWEMLGLAGLAGKEYEKLLKTEEDLIDPMLVDGMSGGSGDGGVGAREQENKKEGKWMMEAAYAMRNMYLMGGDHESAKIVVEKWLVVE